MLLIGCGLFCPAFKVTCEVWPLPPPVIGVGCPHQPVGQTLVFWRFMTAPFPHCVSVSLGPAPFPVVLPFIACLGPAPFPHCPVIYRLPGPSTLSCYPSIYCLPELIPLSRCPVVYRLPGPSVLSLLSRRLLLEWTQRSPDGMSM